MYRYIKGFKGRSLNWVFSNNQTGFKRLELRSPSAGEQGRAMKNEGKASVSVQLDPSAF